ncbi:MAG: hypothetical protein PHV25_00455 [Candidatus Pacebacteria bacterium]|nr:hypothetical protein [Candidatus Paceibacterota bacterium]
MSFYEDYLKNQKKENNTEDIALELRAKLKAKEVSDREEFSKRVDAREESGTVPNIAQEIMEDNPLPKPPQNKSGSAQKFLPRILALFGVVAVILLASIVIQNMGKGGTEVEIQTIVATETVEVIVYQPPAPESFLKYSKFEYPVITKKDELTTQVQQYYLNSYDDYSLVKLSILDQANTKEQNYLKTETFLNSFSLRMPTSFALRVLPEDFNLFLHSRGEYNVLGFAVKISDISGFTGMMREWEDDADDNLKSFLSFLNLKYDSTDQFFTPRDHSGYSVRCKDYFAATEEEIEEASFSVCYSVIKKNMVDYFLFTLSEETMKHVLDSIY